MQIQHVLTLSPLSLFISLFLTHKHSHMRSHTSQIESVWIFIVPYENKYMTDALLKWKCDCGTCGLGSCWEPGCDMSAKCSAVGRRDGSGQSSGLIRSHSGVLQLDGREDRTLVNPMRELHVDINHINGDYLD